MRSAGCAYGVGLLVLRKIKNRKLCVPIFPAFSHKQSQYLAWKPLGRCTKWRSKVAQSMQAGMLSKVLSLWVVVQPETRWWGRRSLDELSSYVWIKTVCINICWSLHVSIKWFYTSVIISYIIEWRDIHSRIAYCLPSRWAWLEPPTEHRNETFSPISRLPSKTKMMSLDILIQVGGPAFKREKIIKKDWLQAWFYQFYSSWTGKHWARQHEQSWR